MGFSSNFHSQTQQVLQNLNLDPSREPLSLLETILKTLLSTHKTSCLFLPTESKHFERVFELVNEFTKFEYDSQPFVNKNHSIVDKLKQASKKKEPLDQ